MNPRFEQKFHPIPGGPEPGVDGDLMDKNWDQPEDSPADVAGKASPTEAPRPFQTWLHRAVAVFILLGFLFLSFGDGLRLLTSPSLDFLATSRELLQNPQVRELQKPVVQIRSYGTGFDQGTRQGTGFNINENGLVVTNRHVIDGAEIVSVQFRDHRVFHTTEWIEHPDADLALLWLDGDNLPIAPLRQGSSPPAGSEVLVVGNPLGFAQTVTKGTIQSYGHIVGAHRALIPTIVIAATVHSGSSGSPVFDAQGRVVGIIFGQLPAQGETPIRGLAIPVNVLLQMLLERG